MLYMNLGISLDDIEKFEDAIKMFDKILEINPNSS